MSKTRKQLEDIWEEVHELGMPSGGLVDEWAKVVNFALAQTETLITRQVQEAEVRGLRKIADQLLVRAQEVANLPYERDIHKIHSDSIRGELYIEGLHFAHDLTHPTPADSLNLSKSKGLKPAKDFDPSQVTLCPGCNQMTHTIMSDTKGNEDYCGKCGKVKPADNSDSGRPEKLGGPQTRDFAAEAKQVEKILNRPHEPDYQCTQCSKSPAEHTTAGAGDTPTKTEN